MLPRLKREQKEREMKEKEAAFKFILAQTEHRISLDERDTPDYIGGVGASGGRGRN